MAIAGRVAIVPKGDWSADATYKRLDAVTYNNTLYFAKKNVPAGTETSNTEYWSKSIVGSVVTVDDALSPTSTNPVQNKVVTSNLIDIRKETTVNLLNPTLQTTTQNGVTCTNNGNGTYTLNGRCTVDSPKITFIVASKNIKIDKDAKFICCTKPGTKDTFRASVDYSDTTHSVDYGEGILLSKGKTITKVSIIVSNGVTVNNLVFKPMLTTNLSATYDDFVPYTGDTGRLNGDVAELKAQSVKKDNVVNNQTTTEAGFALDARQANPNIDGTLAKQLSDLNGSLNDSNNFKFRKVIENWSSASQISGGCGIYYVNTIEDNFYSSISKHVTTFKNVGDYSLIIFSWNGLEALNYGIGLLASPRSTAFCLVQIWDGDFILYDI